MPFEKGNQLRKGVPNPNAGRKPRSNEDELRSLLDDSWPVNERIATVIALVEQAKGGNVNAAKLLFTYGYGTPPSMDEATIQERVDADIEKFFTTLEEKLSPPLWSEVKRAIGIGEGDSEEEAEESEDG